MNYELVPTSIYNMLQGTSLKDFDLFVNLPSIHKCLSTDNFNNILQEGLSCARKFSYSICI